MHLLSHSVCGSGVQIWLSWVLYLGSHKAAIKVSAGAAVSSEASLGRELLQFLMVGWGASGFL